MPSRARRAARCARVVVVGRDPGAAAEPFQGRAEGGAQGLQVAGSLGGGEVDEHATEPACLGHLLDQGGSGVGQAVAQRGQGRGLGVATDEHGAVDQRSAGHVAAQRHRLG